ncbi:MAG: hypothetical protein HN482_09150 [Bdellovibrionales bacterium]|nr:hypothetical protein [Bdellovibrionales bacterium]
MAGSLWRKLGGSVSRKLGGSQWRKFGNKLSPSRQDEIIQKNSPLIEAGLASVVYSTNGGDAAKKIKKIDIPTFKKLKNGIIEMTAPTAAITEKLVNDKLEVLSSFLQTDFQTVEKIDHQKYLLKPELIPKKNSSILTKTDHAFAGLLTETEALWINLKKDFSLYVGGNTGTGKSQTIVHLIDSILKSSTLPIEIVIFDTKGLDYQDLILNGAQFYPMNSKEEQAKALEFLNEIYSDFSKSKKLIEEKFLVDYDDYREEFGHLPLKKYILIFDEAGRYLKANSSDKDHKTIQKDIITVVSNMLATFRVSGCKMIVSTQRVQKDEMDIPYDNFLVRVLSNISKEMDNKYRPENARMSNRKLQYGEWTFSTSDYDSTLCRTPWCREKLSFYVKDKKSRFKQNLNNPPSPVFNVPYDGNQPLIEDHVINNDYPSSKEKELTLDDYNLLDLDTPHRLPDRIQKELWSKFDLQLKRLLETFDPFEISFSDLKNYLNSTPLTLNGIPHSHFEENVTLVFLNNLMMKKKQFQNLEINWSLLNKCSPVLLSDCTSIPEPKVEPEPTPDPQPVGSNQKTPMSQPPEPEIISTEIEFTKRKPDVKPYLETHWLIETGGIKPFVVKKDLSDEKIIIKIKNKRIK